MRFFTFLFLFLLVLNTVSCDTDSNYSIPRKELKQDLEKFKVATQKLQKVARAYQLQEVNEDSLQHTVSLTRLAYKRIEFIVAYKFPGYAKSHFNGAPLLQVDKSGTRANIVPPEGLQVLDELSFSNEAFDKRTEISSLATKLNASYSIIYKDLHTVNFSITDYWNAARLDLIRIFTLGVTGFDTPGSLNGIREARESLDAIHGNLKEAGIKHHDFQDIDARLKESIEFLSNQNDFNSFDRLSFLTNYIEPLYKETALIGEKYGWNLKLYNSPWNPNSTSIFAADFMDPYFFTELTASQDSKELRELGKDLFNEKDLSSSGTISCASCHLSEKAFTDGETKSLSYIDGKRVQRNSPTLLNAVYADRYFYDLRAYTLEQQVEHVIFNEAEFNTAYTEILERLKKNDKYISRFESVFGKEPFKRENLASALASYVLSLQSHNSRFDAYVRGETTDYSDMEKLGFNLFTGKANCATCHFTPTFSGLVPPLFNESESEILGVLKSANHDIPVLDTDMGRIENGNYREDAWIYQRSFKTTTTRNIALSAPYFHNGTYENLEQVIDFYNRGGGAGMGLEVPNQTLSDSSLDLNDIEIEALIAFLNSLTEY